MANPYEKYATATPGPAAAENPYAKYGTPAPTVAPQGVSDALANAFGQGATQNFGDELTAFIRTKLPEFSNWMMKGGRQTAFGSGNAAAPDAPTGGQTVATGPNAYDEELAKVRAQTKADEAQNPNLMAAANIAGNVAGSVPLLAAAPSALTAVSPSLLINAAKMAGTGALLGGTAGFGSGEGGFENRTDSSVIPTIAGALLGGATPFAGAGIRRFAESAPGRTISRNIVDPIADYLVSGRAAARTITPPTPPTAAPQLPMGTPTPPTPPTLGGPPIPAAEPVESIIRSGAMDRLVNAAQRGRFNPQEGQTALNMLGDQAMVADINPALRGEAERANTMLGQTQTLAEQRFNARAGGAPERMTAALEGDQYLPSSYALRGGGQSYDRTITNTGRTAYQGDMVEGGLTQSPELRAMLNNPHVNRAIETVLEADKASRIGRPNASPLSPVEVMHRVKQMVEGLGYREGTAIPGPNMQSFRDLANDYTGTLKRDNPLVAQADRLYSEAKSLPEFFDAGASALRPASMTEAGIERSAPAIADLLQGATATQVEAARHGLLNAARTQVQEGTPRTLALARRLTGGPEGSRPLQQQFQTLAPDVAPGVFRQSAAEQTFADTAKSVREGSPTARRLAQMAEEEGGPNVHLRADPRGITARMYDATADFLKKVQAPNEAVRDEIGRLLLNPDAPQNRELLQRLAIALQQRQAGTPLRAGAVGAASNQLNQVLQ